jgi:hypothetical protein
MAKVNGALPGIFTLSAVFALVFLLCSAGVIGDENMEPVEPSQTDEHALWVGRGVLAIAAAIRNPQAPDAMAAVLELGLDSRYYTMVRGWLALQLSGDKSIAQAAGGEVDPQVAARIAFLQEAIRAIDLE